MARPAGASRVLKLRGLPWEATEGDIREFFSGFKVDTIKIGNHAGKPTGEAWVRFESSCACSSALSSRDKKMLGKRYIELFKAKDQDISDAQPPEVSIPGKCNVIRMRGLPFSACVGDVLDFFKGIPSLDRESVYFVYDSGRPSGEAYIMFSSSEGCTAAMKLHKQKMGARYIELFPSSSADVQRAAKQRKLRLCKPDPPPPAPKATQREKPVNADAKVTKPAQSKVEPPAKMLADKRATASGHGAGAGAGTAAATGAPLKKTFASIAAGSRAAGSASSGMWEQPVEEVTTKLSTLDVGDRVPDRQVAASSTSAPPALSPSELSGSASFAVPAVNPTTAVTPAAVSAHSAASAASSFPSEPFPATELRQELTGFSLPQTQPQSRTSDVQVPLTDLHLFSDQEPALAAAPALADTTGGASMGSSPLRGAAGLYAHEGLPREFGLPQQADRQPPPYAAGRPAPAGPAYAVEPRSAELRGAFVDQGGWGAVGSTGGVTGGHRGAGPALGNHMQGHAQVQGLPQDVPGLYGAGLPSHQGNGAGLPSHQGNAVLNGRPALNGASLAMHNRQNVPPNFPQHVPQTVPRVQNDDVWGPWGQSQQVPGGIRSLWSDVGLSESKKPASQDMFAAFSQYNHQRPAPSYAAPEVGGAGLLSGWGQHGVNGGLQNGMNHVNGVGTRTISQGMHAMSGSGNAQAFYRY